MQALMNAIASFTSGHTIAVYLFIFFGKILEVSISTLRTVLINKGMRVVGCIIAAIEYILWLFITASVLTGYQEDPMKAIALTLAFALGNYIGSWMDEKLALGLCAVSVYLPSGAESLQLASFLREKGFGLTVLDGQGIDGEQKYVLQLTLKRKRTNEAIAIINDFTPNAFITVGQVSSVKGGYIKGAASKIPALFGRGRNAERDS